MRMIIKVFVVWTVGLAMLLASSGVSLALPKIRGGHTYCKCACQNATGGYATLYWEKVASCSLTGGKCTFNNPKDNNQLESGTLKGCEQCTPQTDGTLFNCTAAMIQQPGGMEPLPGGMMQPPGSPPPARPGTVAPGMTSPIMPRGVEGQPGVEGEHSVEQVPAEEASRK
jgi:hypothetical protein